MVDKFQIVLNNLEKAKGPVTLFALLKMDEFIDKWTIVLCASWATPEKRDDAFKSVRDEALAILDSKETSEIARVAIFSRDEHLIEELLRYQTGTTLENQKVNGNVVHFAHIIKSSN